jgi:hypothetical protein
LFNLANPNDINQHNEGVIGDGTLLSYDSTTHPLYYTTPSEDVIQVPTKKEVMSAYGHFEPPQRFFVITTATPPTDPQDAEISLEKARLETSTLSLCNADPFAAFDVALGDDEIQEPVGAAKAQSTAAPAFKL